MAMNGPQASENGQHSEGQRLATLARKDGAEQLRVELKEFKGHKYIDLRIWWQTDDGEWRPSKVGCTVKLRELAEVRDALIEAAELTGAGQRRAPGR